MMMLLHQLRRVNISSINSKVVILMLNTKAGKCRFANIMDENPTYMSELVRELNVDRTTVIKHLCYMLFK